MNILGQGFHMLRALQTDATKCITTLDARVVKVMQIRYPALKPLLRIAWVGHTKFAHPLCSVCVACVLMTRNMLTCGIYQASFNHLLFCGFCDLS